MLFNKQNKKANAKAIQIEVRQKNGDEVPPKKRANTALLATATSLGVSLY